MTDQPSAKNRTVLYEPEGRIGYITLNRPEKLNALNGQLMADFYSTFDEFLADPQVRVGVVRGAGRGFCVGFDLSRDSTSVRPKPMTPWEDHERLRAWLELWVKIWDSPKPIISQVHGYCMAGGVMIPIVSDLVVITEDCRVGWPKLPMGGGYVAPAFASVVGAKRAKEMEFVAGSEIDGRTAAAWGYANKAVPAADLEEEVRTMATSIAKMSSSLLHLKKSAVNKVFDLAGFKETLLAGAEWDTLAHEDPGVYQIRSWIRESGMKESIDRFHREGL